MVSQLQERPGAIAAHLRPLDIQPWRPAGGARVRGMRYLVGPLHSDTFVTLHPSPLRYGILVLEPGSGTPESFTSLLAAFADVARYAGPKKPAADVNAQASVGIPAALYPGSWSAWSADPDRPVARGAAHA